MKRSNPTLQVQSIPLDKLKKSEDNVRKVPHSKAQIEALATSIEAHGLIQNVVVRTECNEQGQPSGFYLVIAGEGRRLAQLLRVKRKKIKADEPIPCVVDDTHPAQAVSLAENELRLNMHPADQFTAFKTLADTGQSIEDIAAQFSVTPLVVKQRLKLANVAPEFIERYRKGTVDMSVLMALALTDDHGKQQEVWKGLRKYEQTAEVIRERLTQHELAVDDPMVKFVGLKTYEKMGGLVRRDLFGGDHGNEGYVMDVDLLRRLADEKLEQQAAKVRAEGHAWVAVVPKIDYAGFAEYGRVQPSHRAPTEEEAASLAALRAKRRELTEAADATEDEGQAADFAAQIEAVESDIGLLNQRLEVPTREQVAASGALVTIDGSGKVRIERNLLKPEDKARFARAEKAARKAASGGPRTHSAALMRRLTAHRTLALQAHLVEHPLMAAVALTHHLVLETCYSTQASQRSAVQIDVRPTALKNHAAELEGCPAASALEAHRKALREQLPPDPEALLPWLVQQSGKNLLAVLAYCVAVTIDGVESCEGVSVLDGIAQAARLNMRAYWAATAESYFNHVPKARILEVVREAISPEVASAISALKKGPLAKAAEARVANKGWLPGPLRTPAAS